MASILSFNTNMMAVSAGRNLSQHYGNLSTSVRRLSSGLRVGQSSDDAAGLAIRELMRADITALTQGVRNSNDAISLIQTADGALGVIDEKLIRMKELAEQAATGTYTSDQRLMIDSEYQAMAKEITRIANATDFNGIHLLNGNLEAGYHNGKELTSTGKMKVHFGSGNDSAEDYYYVQIDDMTAEGLSVGDPFRAVGWGNGVVEGPTQKLVRQFVLNVEERVRPMLDSGAITQADYDAMMVDIEFNVNMGFLTGAAAGGGGGSTFQAAFINTFGAGTVPRDTSFQGPEGFTYAYLDGMDVGDYGAMENAFRAMVGDEKEKYAYAFERQWAKNLERELRDGSIFNPGLMDSVPVIAQADVQAAGIATTQWFLNRHSYAGNNIRTQETAQHALKAIDKAIVVKDQARASLGAMQNRLENTTSNLQIQAENLQAAESRISDVDVAEEMTNFVRNQVLTQAATAMLSQANSMPRMVLSLVE